MRPDPASEPFDGFSRPTYTPVPDELFDRLLPRLSDAELRVLLYIIRRTFGFKRDADAISLSQMVSGITTRDGRVLDTGTGLSKATVARGLAGLRSKGIILAERTRSRARGDEPTTYRLHIKPAGSPSDQRHDPLAQQPDTRVSAMRQAVSHHRDPQQRGDNTTVFDPSNGKSLEKGMPTNEEDSAPTHHRGQNGTGTGMTTIAAELTRHVRPRHGGADRLAIGATIEQIAKELGDRAELSVSIARAMNLFTAAAVHRNAFLDLLFLAKGEVRDRRQFPGKAPLPQNQMAYFFAVVEDRLGLRPPADHD